MCRATRKPYHIFEGIFSTARKSKVHCLLRIVILFLFCPLFNLGRSRESKAKDPAISTRRSGTRRRPVTCTDGSAVPPRCCLSRSLHGRRCNILCQKGCLSLLNTCLPCMLLYTSFLVYRLFLKMIRQWQLCQKLLRKMFSLHIWMIINAVTYLMQCFLSSTNLVKLSLNKVMKVTTFTLSMRAKLRYAGKARKNVQ